MRTFVAVHLPPNEEIIGLYAYLKNNLRGLTVNYINPQFNHITLSFLGEVDQKKISGLHHGFSDIKTGTKKLEIELQGVGIFKNIKHPQVIWVGIKYDKSLQTLYNRITEIVEKNGLETESKPFSPHLTIGRIKNFSASNNLENILNEYENKFFGKLAVNEFIFYESILKPTGPIYKPLYKYPLE